MITTSDQLNHRLTFTDYPKRIISLVPSQTELLFDLGLAEDVIGITKFCIHPNDWLLTKTKIGGTKNLNIEKIRSLSPDLIIANKEENTKDQIITLMKEFPVWVSDVKNLNDAFEMITEISRITNKEVKGKKIIEDISSEFKLLKSATEEIFSCAYLIWKNPMMIAGGGTYISEMLTHAGFKNVFENRNRYPEISESELKMEQPDVIFLSSEPFPFKEKDLQEFQNLGPAKGVYLVDGEMFSWYGSRLVKAPGYFLKLREKINSAL